MNSLLCPSVGFKKAGDLIDFEMRPGRLPAVAAHRGDADPGFQDLPDASRWNPLLNEPSRQLLRMVCPAGDQQAA